MDPTDPDPEHWYTYIIQLNLMGFVFIGWDQLPAADGGARRRPG
jgi:hypothetical protein